MFKSYIKIAIRNLIKHKTYSFINVIGLAVAISVSSIIFVFVREELSYDRHHPNGNRIYKIVEIQMGEGFGKNHVSYTMAPLAPALKADFPEVEYAARLSGGSSYYCQAGDKEFRESNICYADPDLLLMFNLPLLLGDPQTALNEPNSVIIRQKAAEKYFGDENPLGQTIKINNELFKITGIMQEENHRSHMRFNMLLSYSTTKPEELSSWFNNFLATYIMLRRGSYCHEVEKKLPEFLMKYRKVENEWEEVLQMYLMPLRKIHLHSRHILFDCHNYNTGDINNVIIFSTIVILIILIACINYTNLATALVSRRTKEISIRKVCGSNRRQIMSQVFGESILITVCSFFLCIILIEYLMPVLNSFLNQSLTFKSSDYIGVILVTLVTGMFAGLYPAVYMSRFQPAFTLKMFSKGGSSRFNLRKILVVSQFIISVILIISTLVINNQRKYIRNKDLGYNKENIICISLVDKEGHSKLKLLKDELKKHNNILSVAATSRPDGGGLGQSVFNLAEKPDIDVMMEVGSIDMDYIPTMEMKIKDGRNFSEEFVSDNEFAVIVNEETVEKFGVDNALGMRFRDKAWYGKIPVIIGVISNFHFYTLHKEIKPLVFGINPDYYRYLVARIKPDDIQSTVDYIKDVWNKLVPTRPFSYWFLDDSIENRYRDEENMNKLFLYFSGFAIFIACLGLYGLALFSAELRTKEIGIRKVLGASMSGIVFMLSKEFLKWVIIANIIAWPIAYYAMNRWLQNFAYRIEISLWLFILSGLLALVIALLTVSFQAVRAARANPVEALRYE